jgi:transketolase N-terminal domain/subunit
MFEINDFLCNKFKKQRNIFQKKMLSIINNIIVSYMKLLNMNTKDFIVSETDYLIF